MLFRSIFYDYSIGEIPLYKKADVKSEKIGSIKKCEKLKSVERYLLISSFGKGKVIKAYDEFKEGDVVTIEQYGQEGTYYLCSGQRRWIESSSSDNPLLPPVFKTLSLPKTKDWVLVESEKGLKGFTPFSEKNIAWYSLFNNDLLCDRSHRKRKHPLVD